MKQPSRPSHLIKPKTGPEDPELQETLLEGLGQVAPDDVEAIATELAARRERLAPLVDAVTSGGAGEPDFWHELTRAVTATARQAEALCDPAASERTRAALPLLVAEGMPVEERLEAFIARCGLDTRLALELATGVLHLRAPWHYWLWTRWLWDARYGTGILPLLASSSHALEGQSIGVQYRQLRPLIALGAELGRNSGLICADLADDPHIGPFATDAFLAIAYSVYLYGITNWRLSREFNRLLPSVPQLARRLLGLPKLAESRP
ncbi:hypothetical protein OO015_04615 [Thermomicrobium sp. 4228-Ro]|uniref:hypothetical protein n=1 Tax=Thermomicrobium sp. 4228-Ro TaxID=2993937 RepID=UPI0022498FAB|nr:hypothetical protein [Thermomicrobium sp. 4228-Ro]MCX2726777.1 hypothetical protein [Thermomicrobium sp. 4228-Ro]